MFDKADKGIKAKIMALLRLVEDVNQPTNI